SPPRMTVAFDAVMVSDWAAAGDPKAATRRAAPASRRITLTGISVEPFPESEHERAATTRPRAQAQAERRRRRGDRAARPCRYLGLSPECFPRQPWCGWDLAPLFLRWSDQR